MNMNIQRIGTALLAAATLLTAGGCAGDRQQYDATGTFEATEVVVSGEVKGRILEFPVSEGSPVRSGEQVGLIDSTQLHLQKLQVEANIRALESSRPAVGAQLAPLEEQLAKQQRERARVENLMKADVTTAKQLDDITSAITVLEKQLDAQRSALGNALHSTEAQIAAARAQHLQLEEQLARCRITSPIDGTVLAKYAQAGELAVAGKPLMKVADVDNIYLKAYLVSSQLPQVQLGRKVTVYADFGNGERREYEGTVTWIADRSEFTPKNIVTSDDRANMVYAIKVAVRNDGYLKIGMYGGINL